MRYFRNPDVKNLCLLLGLVTLGATIAGFLAGVGTGCLVLLVCLLFCGICLGHTLWRHRQMERLADYLRRITAGEHALDVRDNGEGELSILKSEIYKVTVMLGEYNDQLQAEKLQLADSLADISHQLKTPLTSMLMMTDLLSGEDLPADKREEFTRHIRIQLERIQWLVSSLLKMSRLDAGVIQMKAEPVRAAELAREASAPLLIPMELKEQTLDMQGDPAVTFTGDRRWSAEALLNVMKNCMEHTPRGGRVTVRWTANPIYTEITVTDTGPGIAPEDLPHIFTRFYRGKAGEADAAESAGVCIGLAMAKSILARQNGKIFAESPAEGGSRFTLRFYKTVV